MDNKLTTPDIVVAASGLVAFVFSFFAYFGEGDFSINGWDEFPLFTYPALCGLVAAGVILLSKLAGVSLPRDVLGFTWTQIHLVLGIFATLVSLGVFIAGEDAKAGLIITLLASIGMIVGAVMMREGATEPRPGGAPL